MRDGKQWGIGEKRGDFREKSGIFVVKVGRFSPVDGECVSHLGGNDGGLAVSVKIEANKPRNTGQNGTKKSRRLRDVAVFGTNVGDGRRNKRQTLRVYAYLFSSVVGALSMRSRN